MCLGSNLGDRRCHGAVSCSWHACCLLLEEEVGLYLELGLELSPSRLRAEGSLVALLVFVGAKQMRGSIVAWLS